MKRNTKKGLNSKKESRSHKEKKNSKLKSHKYVLSVENDPNFELIARSHENLSTFIKHTNQVKKPMENWSRVLIETEDGKSLAAITNDNFELATGIKVGLLTSND